MALAIGSWKYTLKFSHFLPRTYSMPCIKNKLTWSQFGSIPRTMRSSRWCILGSRQLTEQEAHSELPHLTTARFSTSWTIISQLIRSLSFPCLSSSSAGWLTFSRTDNSTNRQQVVRLARECLSKWADILSGVPQETKLRLWLFLLMINDLRPPQVQTWHHLFRSRAWRLHH